MPKRAHIVTKSEPLPGERELDQDLLNRTLNELNGLYSSRGSDTARQLGEVVLNAFFAGQTSRFRERSRRHATFRTLCNRPDLLPSYSFLWYAVAVVEQYQQLPSDIAEALPLSHHRLLLPIHDLSTKLRLAKKARDNNLSKRRLEELVRKERARQPSPASRGGRPPLPTFVKGLNRLKQAVDLAVADEITERSFERYPTEDAKVLLSRLYSQLEQLSSQAENLRDCLTRLEDPTEAVEGSDRAENAAK